MANNDYGIRFTDNMYATRRDVEKTLNTSLVDSFWKNVIDYRSQYQKVISLRNITKSPFRLTFTSNIVTKISMAERKLNQLISDISNFSSESKEIDKLANHLLFQRLNAVFGLQITEKRFAELINNVAEDITQKEESLLLYYNAIKEIRDFEGDVVNEENISRIYSRIIDSSSFIVFYRERDIGNQHVSLFSREYTSAPTNMIEPMMTNFIDFINNSEQSISVKLAACFYSINLIKPFGEKDDFLSILVCKALLSNILKNKFVAYLPLEDLLLQNKDRLKELFLSVQKENDLTYILVNILDILNSSFDKDVSSIKQYSLKEAEKELLFDETVIETPKEEPKVEPIVEKEAVVEEKTEEPKPIIEDTADEFVSYETIEEQRTEIEENPEFEEIEEPIKETETIKVEEPKASIKIAKSKTTTIASEKSAYSGETDPKKIEEYLLETNPLIKKAQAKFYAKHCTFGRFYTIQQYKKFVGCVYETARTSMDNLAALGYYKKEQIKNKFVYTPIEIEN